MDNKWSYLKCTVSSPVSSAFHLQGPKQEVRGYSAGIRSHPWPAPCSAQGWQPCNCSDVAPAQVCALRRCLSMLYPKAQIPMGIWEPPGTVKLRCLHAMQILAWGFCCFIHSCFTSDLGLMSEMAERARWSLKAFCGQNPALAPAWFRSHIPFPGRGRRAAPHCTGGRFPTQGTPGCVPAMGNPFWGTKEWRGAHVHQWLSCRSVATVWSKPELVFPAYENLYFSIRLCLLMLSIFEYSSFALCVPFHPCCTCPLFKSYTCASEQASRLWHVLCVFISSKAAVRLHDV